jgi:hypothetical protein
MTDTMPGEEGYLHALECAGNDGGTGLAKGCGEVVFGDIFQSGHAVQPGTSDDGQGGIYVHNKPIFRDGFYLLYPKKKWNRRDKGVKER